MPNPFQKFISEGIIPPTAKQRAAMLDQARSKIISQAQAREKTMPVTSAIIAEAKRLDVSCDEVAGKFVSGEIDLPHVDAMISASAAANKKSDLGVEIVSKTPAAPTAHQVIAGAFRDALSGKATAKPAPGVRERLAEIMRTGDLDCATAFYRKNEAAIKAAQAADINAANLKAVKPTAVSAYSTYQKLQADPIKASTFLAVNRAAIVASKPAGVTLD